MQRATNPDQRTEAWWPLSDTHCVSDLNIPAGGKTADRRIPLSVICFCRSAVAHARLPRWTSTTRALACEDCEMDRERWLWVTGLETRRLGMVE